MKLLKAIRQLVRDTLHRFVQFFHIGFRLWIVWGLGFAVSFGGGWQIDSAWEWMALQIEWKLYIGPLIVVGQIPYKIKRCPHKLNPSVLLPHAPCGKEQRVVGGPND